VPLNSSGQAAISDSDLTVIPNPGLSLTFGAHTIEAKFTANDGYTSGSDVTTDVTVSPAALTVTGSSPTVTYGAAAPTISPQYSGFAPGDSAASLASAPACSTTYVQGDGVTTGGYPATCTGGSDPNYSFTYDQGAVTVTQAPLTVDAADESMVYGGKVPTYGFSYSGFVGSDGPSSVATSPTCGAQDPATNGAVTASTHWGTYPITCSGGTAQNYSFSYVAGTLIVSEFASSLVYSGDQTVLGGSTFNAAAQVYSSAGACPSGQAVSFSLDRNPVTGATGSYLLGGATSTGGSASVPVPTTGWKPGGYSITAASEPTVTCSGGSQSATLTVGTAGSNASASGTYSLTGQGKVTFSLTAATSSAKTTGQIIVSTGQWQFTGTVSSYVIAGSAGSATGSGQLSLWNQSLNKGKGGWQLVASGVSITASFTASVTGPSKVPGTFGVNIVYSPTSSQPALPNSAPQSIGGGNIKVS